MQGEPTDFWGKLKKNDAGVVEQWHPLLDHCADVAACCEALLERTLLGRRLAVLAGLGALTRQQIARLSVIAALHDLGKPNLGFQNKSLQAAPLVAGHVREALGLLGGAVGDAGRRLREALPLGELGSWGPNGAAGFLLVAAIGHHGRPYGARYHNHDPRLWVPARGLDPFVCIRRLVEATRRWFPEAWSAGGEPLPDAPAFQHAFAGLVMLADWLGSDAEVFRYSEPSAGDRMAFSREAAARALALIGLDSSAARTSLGPKPPGFERVSEHSPRGAQARLLDLALPAPGTVDVLEAETGSGKTEAALAHFARLLHAGLVDGLYFALPTRTAATQIFARTHAAVERAFPDAEARPPVVLAVPGYLQVDGATGRRLPGFEVLWNDVEKERFRFRGWAAENPKRYLAGAVVVGTVDQVLLSTLMVPHAHLRATSLLRQLLVVDEVHASDAYMNRLLEQVLAFHAASGGHALLMSATLGSAARQRFLRAGPPPSLEAACAHPYPSITRAGLAHAGAPPSPQVEAVPPDKRTKTVSFALEPLMDDEAAVAAMALAAAQQGAKVLLLRNTVRACVETQAALEAAAEREGKVSLLFRCGGVVAPHHSRFAPDDRKLLDQAIEASFGQKRPEGGCVVVATQTVQQSLDLDADLLLTDLCPMDVLLQRVGRLHRHERARPAGFDRARCVVLRPAERDLGAMLGADGKARGPCGLGRVYDDLRIIEATLRAIEATSRSTGAGVTIAIPADNRALVERTTHPEALAAVARELGEAWQEHQSHCFGGAAVQRTLAALQVVRREEGYGSNKVAFPEDALLHEIKTRLGEADRIAAFAAPPTGPFGLPVRQLNVPEWQVRGIAPDAPVALTGAFVGGFTFDFGGRTFAYDRLGLRLTNAASSPGQADEESSDA